MNLIKKLKIKAILPLCVVSTMVGLVSLSSCVEEISFGGAFLDKQPSVDVTSDTIFAKGENAKRFLCVSSVYFCIFLLFDNDTTNQ